MLCGVMDACESNGTTAMLSGRLDQARGRLGVDRLVVGGRRSTMHPNLPKRLGLA